MELAGEHIGYWVGVNLAWPIIGSLFVWAVLSAITATSGVWYWRKTKTT